MWTPRPRRSSSPATAFVLRARIEELERRTGQPVLEANQVLLWSIARLRTSGHRGGPVLATYKRLGLELLPLAVDRLDKAKKYSRLTIDLDPLVASAIRFVSEHPEFASILDSCQMA